MEMPVMQRGPLRWEVTVPVKFSGPMRVGTSERLSVATDAPLLRDAGGSVWLPGSSVRGVLRDWCEREALHLGFDSSVIASLFGGTSDGIDRQGRLTVLDARIEEKASTIRDHVCIDPELGAGAIGGKFDEEIAFADGAVLRLVYEGDQESVAERELLQTALDALSAGVLAFGSGSGIGFGWVRATTVAWIVRDRATVKELSDYLSLRLSLKEDSDQPIKSGDLGQHGSLPSPAGPPLVGPRPPLSWLRLAVRWEFDGPTMVAASTPLFHARRSDQEAQRAGEVDASYLVDPDGRPVVPGAGIRGAVRAYAARMAIELGMSKQFEIAFGSTERRGLVRLSDGGLVDDKTASLVMNHVAIDRITSFAVEGKLFSTLALASPAFNSEILLLWPPDDTALQAVGLVLMTLRDAQAGLLWFGSRTTRGYGHLKRMTICRIEGSMVEGRNRRVLAQAGPKSMGEVAAEIHGLDAAWAQVAGTTKKAN